MKANRITILLLAVQVSLATLAASAHPGSGIVVDELGNVYFIHSGRGVGKIDPEGKLSYVHEARDGHWLCLDTEGRFSRRQPRYFERVTPDGVKPALIYAGGGSPIAVLRDGFLYYVSGDERLTPGGLQVTRESPVGELAIFPSDGKKTTEKFGITGLAPGPEGVLYIAQPNAVLKLEMNGTFTRLAGPIDLRDCDVDYPDHNPNQPLPFLRGLAVDEHGTVFAAAVGCHAVLKISPDGKVETILKVERPWSPTGVAVHRGDIYILEYTNANGSPTEGWRPRVRKLARNGTVTTLMSAPALGGG